MDTYSAPGSCSKTDFGRRFGLERHVEIREAFDPHWLIRLGVNYPLVSFILRGHLDFLN